MLLVIVLPAPKMRLRVEWHREREEPRGKNGGGELLPSEVGSVVLLRRTQPNRFYFIEILLEER